MAFCLWLPCSTPRLNSKILNLSNNHFGHLTSLKDNCNRFNEFSTNAYLKLPKLIYYVFFCFSVNNLANATICVRYQDDVDEAACLSAYQRNMCLENRDSMGLLAAIFTGREVKARELLALPWTNINAQYANGNTPLILAVQGNKEPFAIDTLEIESM